MKLRMSATTNRGRLWKSLLVAVVITGVIAVVALSRSSSVLGQNQILGGLFTNESSVAPPGPVTESMMLTAADTTLDQLHRDGITVYYPSYLPEPLSSAKPNVARLTSDNPAYNGIDLQLTFESGWSEQQNQPHSIRIEQSELKGPTQINIPSPQVIRRLEINGNQAVYYNPGFPPDFPNLDNYKTLMVIVGKHAVTLRGTVGFDELVKIAQSLKAQP